MAEDHEDDALEMARCAEINFKNAIKLMPSIHGNPTFRLAQEQLAVAIRVLGEETATIADQVEHAIAAERKRILAGIEKAMRKEITGG